MLASLEVTRASAIRACDEGQQWQAALQIFRAPWTYTKVAFQTTWRAFHRLRGQGCQRGCSSERLWGLPLQTNA